MTTLPAPGLPFDPGFHPRGISASKKVDDISHHESRHDAKHLPEPGKQKAEKDAQPTPNPSRKPGGIPAPEIPKP
ncbi:MAG: hypothetical protein IPL96_02505 [Holophagaceae bacterium]|nr:hypothetical protein [Holophagaceae bacterium]